MKLSRDNRAGTTAGKNIGFYRRARSFISPCPRGRDAQPIIPEGLGTQKAKLQPVLSAGSDSQLAPGRMSG